MLRGMQHDSKGHDMAKKVETSQTPALFFDIFKSTQSMLPLNPVLAPQIGQFWEAQEKILAEAEAFTRHWFERRHDATRTALEAAQKAALAGSGNPTEAMQAMTEWQRHSMERMAEDAREWFEMVSRCASQVTEGEAEAVGESVKEATEMAREAGKTSKTTPV